MKLNKILMALSAMAIVGCSSEDFNDPSATQAINDSRLIELNENFVLAGVGEVDNTMRTHWEQAAGGSLVNKFLPIFTTAPAGGNLDTYVDATAQSIGLCWVGNGAVGSDVYTNYQFYHFGWLNNDETAANIECDALTNGAMYNEITVAAGAAIGDEADPADFTLPAQSATAGLNYNSGIYKTENKAIFGGDYIVYYPYNEDFKDAGTIPAVAQTSFDWNIATVPANPWEAPELGEATFRYSAPVHIDGGKQAADFGLKNLSTLVRLRVSTVDGDANINDEIDKIILYSPSQKLLKQANLAADKIAAGKEGAELYAETEGIKTITTNFIGGTPTALNVKTTTTVSAYITVLPTNVDDLVALVHNKTDKQWAKIEMPATEFKAGAAKVLDITVKAADFKSDFIAVDQASLVTALTEARVVATDADHAQTITVIGDIKLTANLDINAANDAFITIKGDDIIVPEDKTLTLKTNMESNVRVLGKSCCTGAAGGILKIAGGTINNVTMEPTDVKIPDADDNPTLNYTGAATVAAGKTIDVQAGNVEVNALVAHKGDIKIAEGVKVTVKAAGGLNFMGSNVTNDGTIEVEKLGKFDMTNSDGGATAAAGKRMTNNGTFIHNVDAAVGTAVQSMNQNGEYRCKVDEQAELDDAYQKWTACSVIEMVTPTPAAAVSYDLKNACQHKVQGVEKYIDIEVNSVGYTTTFNNPTDGDKGDDKNIQIGNLTVIAGGLDVVFVGTVDPKNKRTLTVNGDMTVAANTTLTSSKKIDVKENLTVVKGAAATTLTYKKDNGSLAVAKDINVNGADFVADDDALNITCTNFYLKKGTVGATATFGNRTAGDAKNMVVSGTIDNPSGCTFDISVAAAGKLQAWVSCTELKVGGTFPGAQPQVVE